jgi:glucokinase
MAEISLVQAIAVDLGGTRVRAARVDQQGNILDRTEVPTASLAGPEAVLDQVAGVVRTIKQNASGVDLAGVGVSAPGPLDTIRGVALGLPTIKGFDNYPLLSELKNRLQLPVILENDAIAAAIGEWRFGAGAGYANIVYVTVSTGIGGGVIVDNHVVRGRQGMACHIGHMILVPDGAPCNCGCIGCFEAYGAGPAFEARANWKAATHPGTVLGRHGQSIDAEAVFTAAQAGDALSQELVREESEILGTGFTSLAHVFSPDVIIMGGGLSNQFEALYGGIQNRFQQLAMAAFKNTRIMCAKLGGNSGLIGAASMVFDPGGGNWSANE